LQSCDFDFDSKSLFIKRYLFEFQIFSEMILVFYPTLRKASIWQVLLATAGLSVLTAIYKH